MRKIALGIAVILFFIPFFWLKPGFVDLGGDSGRFYFVSPLETASAILLHKGGSWPLQYSMVPYELFLYTLSRVGFSPTVLIDIERGLQIAVAFFATYLIAYEFIANGPAAITAGMVYISLITKSGWTNSLVTHNQVFLNPLMFYLLLRFFKTSSWWYGWGILAVSLLYSGNFGFSAAPNLFAFYPLAVIYLAFLKKVKWRMLLVLVSMFALLHAFHLVPLVTSFLSKNTPVHSYVLSSGSIRESGVHYFEVNHDALGKISTNLFQPSVLVPLVIVAGFIGGASYLMVLTGVFFTVTLFFVSANVTHVGVSLYRLLFFIPGFMMFRSFNETWYYVFAFFYTLLFALSFKKIAKPVWSVLVIVILLFQLIPFFQGKQVYTPYYQSKNVASVLKVDADLVQALAAVRTLPEGKFLTLPLTFPYYQVVYGKEGGAYVGPTLIENVAGRDDYAGFWAMGEFGQNVFDALRANDTKTQLFLFNKMGIHYIFYNSDTRIMDDFPGYPYIYPGLMYSSKDQVPAIRDQVAYKKLLSSWPLTIVYQKGFYTVYEIHY